MITIDRQRAIAVYSEEDEGRTLGNITNLDPIRQTPAAPKSVPQIKLSEITTKLVIFQFGFLARFIRPSSVIRLNKTRFLVLFLSRS